uniref:Uncharacterized protein n=1 Tax=uncultured prokaryote TaxID=198431 RepID=A0A0H5Q6Y5_9ZZZZ|nr:hypothetical protein [uncultured prokaryote]
MAITGDALLINLRYSWLGQKCQTGQYYTPGGAAFLTANADAVGEAWWQDVKAAWRALVVSDASVLTFDSVIVEEFNGSGGLGEFAIPTAERLGTRVLGGSPEPCASYNAVGVRLTVPTRNTRPGQKRFPVFYENDLERQVIAAAYLALIPALAAKYSNTLTLGAPVALGTLTPIIIKYDPNTGAELDRQDVAGFVVNPDLTTQVSRRKGHGS